MMNKLKLIDRKILQSTENGWKKSVGEDVFAIEYAGLFNTIANEIDAQKCDYHAIFQGRTKTADAIVHIVSSPGSAKTKLLTVLVNPCGESGSYQDFGHLVTSAIAGAFEISAQDQTKVVKIYGRTEKFLAILVEIHANWPKIMQSKIGLSTKMAGRWLEFHPTKRVS